MLIKTSTQKDKTNLIEIIIKVKIIKESKKRKLLLSQSKINNINISLSDKDNHNVKHNKDLIRINKELINMIIIINTMTMMIAMIIIILTTITTTIIIITMHFNYQHNSSNFNRSSCKVWDSRIRKIMQADIVILIIMEIEIIIRIIYLMIYLFYKVKIL